MGLLQAAKRQHTARYEARRLEEEAAAAAVSGQGSSGAVPASEAPAPSEKQESSPGPAEASRKEGTNTSSSDKEEEKDEDGAKGLSELLFSQVCMEACPGNGGGDNVEGIGGVQSRIVATEPTWSSTRGSRHLLTWTSTSPCLRAPRGGRCLWKSRRAASRRV